MAAAIDLTARALVLLCLAWMAATTLRRRSASLRALVWTTALAGLLLLPAVSQVVPAWRVPIWTAPPTTQAAASLLPSVSVMPATTDGTPEVSSSVAVHEASAGDTAAAVAPAAAATADWAGAGLVVSGLITLLLLTRLAASHARLARLSRTAPRIGGAWIALVNDVREQLAIGRAVHVRVSDAVNVPAVAGVLTPTLLLPADAREWTPEEQRAVALHELAHVARWDAVAQLVGQVACAVYWFVPPVWYAAQRAAALRERASDDAVLRAGVAPTTYADSLIRLARSAGGAELQVATLAMARPSRMRERVVAILDPVARRGTPGPAVMSLVVVFSASAVAALAAVAPVAAGAGAPEHVVVRADPAEARWASSRVIARDARPSVPLPAQTTARLCDRGLDSSSSSITEDDGLRKWRVTLKGDRCTVDLRAEGRIDFTADFTDISTIGPGGFFRLDLTDGGVRRQLEIEPRNGSLARTWRVDGREQPYDAAARAWFASFLIELDRRTAIGADIRLPHLLRQGGVDAVLNETALMSSDYARGQYYTRLVRAATLSPADVTRVLRQAATVTASDHYAHELLKAFAGRGLDDAAQREAVSAMIDRMKSDHYRAESIQVLVASGRTGPTEMDFLVRMIPRMSSDHYKLQTLTMVLRRGALNVDQQAALARLASSIESDHYAAEFLKALLAAGPMSPPVRQAFVEAVGRIESDHYASEVLKTLIREPAAGADIEGILRLVPTLESDHYRSEVFTALLGVRQLTERDLLGIVTGAAPMSDHYESETLRRVLRHPSAAAGVRTAVLDAAQRMSSHYANEIRRAAGRD